MIVDNLNTFVKKNRITGWNIVDIEGNYSGNNLVLKSRQMSEHGNIIGREKKLEDIKKELESLSSKEHKIKKEIELKHESIDRCKNEINLLMKKRDDCKKIFDDFEKDIIRNQLLIQQVDEKLNYFKNELSDVKINLELAQKVLIDLEPKIKKSKNIMNSFEKRVAQSNEKMLFSR